MGDTRFKYGIAYGPYASFYVRSDNTFAQADSSPDVTLGSLFFTNNTSNTTITDFEFSVPGPVPGGTTHTTISQYFEGKEIRVCFLDNSTRLAASARMQLNSSDGLLGTNNMIGMIYHNSSWIEEWRSYNNSQIIQVESKNLYGVYAGTGGIDVRGNVKQVRIVSATGSAATIRVALGGEQGQIITLVASGASDALIIVNSATNIDGTFVVTSSTTTPTQFRLMSSGAISFTKLNNQWLEIRPVSGNSSGQLQ